MKIWITDAHGRTHIYRTPRKPTLLSEFYCGDVRHHGQLSGKRGERKQEVVVGCTEKDIKRIFSRYTRLHSELRVLSGHLRTAWTFAKTHPYEWVFLVETDESYPQTGTSGWSLPHKERRRLALYSALAEIKEHFLRTGKTLRLINTRSYRYI